MSLKLRGFQNISIVIALVCSLLSLASAPAQAVVPPAQTCAEGGPCVVGDIGPGGGRVFYVATTTFTQLGATGSMCSTNCKYLEAAPSGWNGVDEPSRSWATDVNGNRTTRVPDTGALQTAIGTGYQNSNAIVAQTGNVSATSAAVLARAYQGNGLTDWYLPSRDELNQMCKWVNGVAWTSDATDCTGGTLNTGAGAAGFINESYWSSTEVDIAGYDDFGWQQSFNTGNSGWSGKFGTTYLRPIRAFAPATKVAVTRASAGTERRVAFTTQPQIAIQYANNDTATVSSAVVTATVSTGGTLLGTTTATASSGIATFSNLGIDGTVGTTYTITYTATGLTVATATVTLTGTTCDGSTFICQVGDTGPGGGKIFYIASGTFTQGGATGSMCSTNCKYLEAAPTSGTNAWTDAAYVWSGNVNTAIGTTSTEIGAGYKNTLSMISQSNSANRAGTVSQAYRGPNNLTDWYLPSKDELNELYLKRGIVGGFANDLYWSSSESGVVSQAEYSWIHAFDLGNQNYSIKYLSRYVRPIRAFGPPITITPIIPTYRITYNSNTSEASLMPYDPNPYTSGQQFTVASQTPSRIGYAFIGWNSKADGSGTAYSAGKKIDVVTSDVILYAIWKINQYVLSFNPNGGPDLKLDSKTQDFNSSVTVPQLPGSASRVGYTFIGWNTKIDGSGASYSPGDNLKIPGFDLSLFAQWKINQYTVSYDANRNLRGRVPASVTRDFNSIIKLNAPSKIFTRKGYTFAGWNTEKDGSGKNYQVGDSFTLSARDQVLYAYWQPNTYLVKFFNNSNEYLPSSQFVTDGVISSAPTPKDRPGFAFKGWSSKPDRSDLIKFPFKPNVLRNITLYAVWERIK